MPPDHWSSLLQPNPHATIPFCTIFTRYVVGVPGRNYHSPYNSVLHYYCLLPKVQQQVASLAIFVLIYTVNAFCMYARK